MLVPGIKGVMAKYPLGSVPVSYGGHELWVGQESYYTGMLSKDGEEVAGIAGVQGRQRGGAGETHPPER